MGMLRERMAEDLKLRGVAPVTAAAYLRSAQRFVDHYGRSPLKLGEDEVRSFLLHRLKEDGVSTSTQGVCLAGLKFLYRVTLNRPEVVARLSYPRQAQRLPEVLTGSQVQRLLSCITPIRHRMICTLCYGVGLRISEACSLRPEHVDSARGIIHIRQGKGRRDRDLPLGHKVLSLLRDYWKVARPKGGYLFPGARPERPVTRNAVCDALRQAARRADPQEGHAPRASAQLRHPPARDGRRPAHHPGPARPYPHQLHAALSPRGPAAPRRGQEPLRCPRHAGGRGAALGRRLVDAVLSPFGGRAAQARGRPDLPGPR
jgi:integrase/recombinase XerD